MGAGRLEGSDLGRPFHGVRHPSGDELTLVQRCFAFATIMPRPAFFSSVTAAQLMHIPLPRLLQSTTQLHVAVPAPSRSPRAKGIVGHKIQLMGNDTVVWNGLRHSSPERAWCELGPLLQLDELVAAGDHLIHWRAPLTSLEQLVSAVDRFPSPRGKPMLRNAVQLLDAHAESPMESRTRLILVRSALPPFVPNFPVSTPAGHYRLDFACSAYRIYIEYQGAYHFDIDQQRRDLTRRSRLDAIDWRGIEITVRDLDNPSELTARIAAVLRLRGWTDS